MAQKQNIWIFVLIALIIGFVIGYASAGGFKTKVGKPIAVQAKDCSNSRVCSGDYVIITNSDCTQTSTSCQYGCSGGYCYSCYDYDGGKYPSVAGYVLVGYSAAPDSCRSTTSIREYVCDPALSTGTAVSGGAHLYWADAPCPTNTVCGTVSLNINGAATPAARCAALQTASG